MSHLSSLPLLSVVVKCYNEEQNLARCLESTLAATVGLCVAVIVVDSLSSDASASIAGRYPVDLVQLAADSDRRCGAVAQLGYQHARGEFMLLIDGDMQLMQDFLPAALRALEEDAGLAGVGGLLIEMSDGLEFRERQLRAAHQTPSSEIRHITGCGLYRLKAIHDLGYFTDRNLHCFEEFELGLRLRAHGWRFHMLDLPCVRHYGHRDPSLRLLVRRWQTHFFQGYGELLRSAWHCPYRLEAARVCRVALLTVAWWAALLGLAAATAGVPWLAACFATLLLFPWLALIMRKASVARATHGLLTWQFAAASLLGGLFARRHAPTSPVPGHVLKESRACFVKEFI